MSEQAPQLQIDKDLANINEEFNNFLHRVTQISGIVKNLASPDTTEQNLGMIEADRILNTPENVNLDKIDENTQLHTKSDRTILNMKALHKKERKPDDESMDPETFMDEVSKDADRRYKDKLVRTERMETFKAQATKAFRRGEYERALCCYNKAIEQIKDNPLLYNNRAVTQIKLGRHEKALDDLKLALRLNENGLRSFLLLCKCYIWLRDENQLRETIKEAKEKNPDEIEFIDSKIDEMVQEKLQNLIE